MRTKLPKKYTPINPRCAHMLHGGDYNSDQWIRTPEIWDEDMHLMNYTTAKQTVNLGSQPGADLDCVVQYFDRDACRLPDAMWFTISPKAVVNDGWRLDKMGQEISPFDVINRGNRRLHAVRDTVTYNGPEGCCEIIPLDSPLTAPGKGEL